MLKLLNFDFQPLPFHGLLGSSAQKHIIYYIKMIINLAMESLINLKLTITIFSIILFWIIENSEQLYINKCTIFSSVKINLQLKKKQKIRRIKNLILKN